MYQGKEGTVFMNVIYASDNRFAPILAVSLTSLYRTNKDVNVLIIENGISKENKELLNNIATKHSAPGIIYGKGRDIESDTGIAMKKDRGSLAQFGRLFFEKLIPESWEKIIYLDCDTLILKSLEGLWKQDLGNYPAGGIRDAFSKENYRMLGISIKDVLINSGVMLIDVTKWREQQIEKKIISYIRYCNGQMPQGDQGIINYVLRGKIRQLPPEFNVVEYLYDFSYDEVLLYRKPINYYSRQQIKEAKEAPVVVHFTTSFASVRPWQGDSSNPYGEVWKGYYYELYPGKRIGQQKLSFSKRILMKALYGKTRNITLCVIGLIHSVIKPVINCKIYYIKKRMGKGASI